MKILIPTLGRMDKQITYKNLPKQYQDKTTFVVQEHEFDEMSSRYPSQVMRLPSSINKIAATREYIFNQFKDERHVVYDDDLNFVVREPNTGGDTKWKTKAFDEKDFEDMFETLNTWMDEGIRFGGLSTTWVIPSLDAWPYSENGRMMTNWFFDGPNIPRDLEWCRVQAAEDFDINLQLLTRGFKNRISGRYIVSCAETNAPGGCSTWRTVEVHNQAQLELQKLWPDFVKTKEKVVPNGPWKGLTKLQTTIQHKKAYQSSQQNSLDEFFG